MRQLCQKPGTPYFVLVNAHTHSRGCQVASSYVQQQKATAFGYVSTFWADVNPAVLLPCLYFCSNSMSAKGSGVSCCLHNVQQQWQGPSNSAAYWVSLILGFVRQTASIAACHGDQLFLRRIKRSLVKTHCLIIWTLRLCLTCRQPHLLAKQRTHHATKNYREGTLWRSQ